MVLEIDGPLGTPGYRCFNPSSLIRRYEFHLLIRLLLEQFLFYRNSTLSSGIQTFPGTTVNKRYIKVLSETDRKKKNRIKTIAV